MKASLLRKRPRWKMLVNATDVTGPMPSMQQPSCRRLWRLAGQSPPSALGGVVEAVVEVWGAERFGLRVSPTGSFNAMEDARPGSDFWCLHQQA